MNPMSSPELHPVARMASATSGKVTGLEYNKKLNHFVILAKHPCMPISTIIPSVMGAKEIASGSNLATAVVSSVWEARPSDPNPTILYNERSSKNQIYALKQMKALIWLGGSNQ